jgi:4-oxalocrotonate tautomerase
MWLLTQIVGGEITTNELVGIFLSVMFFIRSPLPSLNHASNSSVRILVLFSDIFVSVAFHCQHCLNLIKKQRNTKHLFLFIVLLLTAHIGGDMVPIVTIMMLEGRTVEQKRKLAKAVTEAIVESLGPPATTAGTRIMILDLPKTNFAAGGVLTCDTK